MRDSCDILVGPTSDGLFISDHCFATTVLSTSKPVVERKTITVSRIKHIDQDQFRDDLSNIVHDMLDNPAELSMRYDHDIREPLDHHAPLLEKKITLRYQVPWFNSDDLKLKHQL